jgi:glycosyltransferase involved in cell wall biosynthesis
MNLGGVEKSWIELISQVNPKEYNIHLGLLNMKGDLLKDVPSWVKVHHINCYWKYWNIINRPPQENLLKLFKQRAYIQWAIFLFIFIWCKLTHSRRLLYHYILLNAELPKETYDLAIAYAGPGAHIDYVIEIIKAKKKCCWIHFDISKVGLEEKMVKTLYATYTKIFCVSEQAKEIFDSQFPELSTKTEVYFNTIRRERIQAQSKEYKAYSDNFCGIRILTIGRLSKEKGQLLALDALNILLQHNVKAKWYFVGEGNTLTKCQEKVTDLGLEHSVEFCGAKTNPYPYIKGCDVYVQPSLHEGYCITLAEARVFSQPIVATDFTGAKEQLTNRANAYITKINAESLAKGILMASNSPRITNEDYILQSDINQILTLC